MSDSTAERLTPEEERIAREKHTARALRRCREGAGLSEKECAAALGCSVALWRSYESVEDRCTLKSSDIAKLPEAMLVPYLRAVLQPAPFAVSRLPRGAALPSESLAMIAGAVKETADVAVAHALATSSPTLSALEALEREADEAIEQLVSLRDRARESADKMRAPALRRAK